MEVTLKATMVHCDDQGRDLEAVQAESASLAAIAASAALALANAASTVRQACAALDSQATSLRKLGAPALKVRTVKMSRLDDSDLGLDLGHDKEGQNPGVRVRHVRSGTAAAIAVGDLSVGDVIVAVNGELVLDASLEAVMRILEASGPTVELSVVSADEIDDDDSPFWQQDDAVEWEADSSATAVTASHGSSMSAGKKETASAASMSSDVGKADGNGGGEGESASIVDSATEAVRSRTEAVANQVANLEASVASVSKGFKSTSIWVDSLSAKLAVSRRRASTLAEKLRRCNEDLDNTSAALASTVLDLEARDVALDAAAQERESLEKAIHDLGARLADASTRATSHSIEADMAKKLCTDIQAAKAEADGEVKRLSAALDLAVQAKNALSAKLVTAETRVAELEAALEKSKSEHSALRASVCDLEDQHRLATDGETAMSQELISLTTTYATLPLLCSRHVYYI